MFHALLILSIFRILSRFTFRVVLCFLSFLCFASEVTEIVTCTGKGAGYGYMGHDDWRDYTEVVRDLADQLGIRHLSFTPSWRTAYQKNLDS
jgi:hypothetical protein